MSKLITVFVLFFLLISLIASSGCWDRRAIEEMAFINAVGIDKDDDEVLITKHIARPLAIAGQEPLLEERPFWVPSARGKTISDAASEMFEKSPRLPFWAHNEFILIGEEFAREGTEEMLAFFLREPETRRRTTVVAVEGTARNLLQAEFELERMPAQGGAGIIRGASRSLGTTAVTEINDFVISLETPGIEPVAGRVEIMPRPPEGEIEGEMKREEIYQSARAAGSAVFKKDLLVGWLDERQTRGLLWVQDKIDNAEMTIPFPTDPEHRMHIRVFKAQSNIEIDKQNGNLERIIVYIDVMASIKEVTRFWDPIENYDIWNKAEIEMENKINEEIEDSLQSLQKDYSSDAFGFGAHIYRRHRNLWDEIGEDWDHIFADLNVKLKTTVQIEESGLLMRPTQIQ